MKVALQTFRFEADELGPRFLLLGGVHGNETCGPQVLDWLLEGLETKQWKLLRGSLTIVPECNPLAIRAKSRQVNVNLNRIIRYHSDPQTVEQEYANDIYSLISDSDYLVDFHSFHSEGEPFVFLDSLSDKWAELALSTGLQNVVVGWNSVYPENGADVDTVTAIKIQGGIGVTIECGYHRSAESVRVGKLCVSRVLNHYGICEFPNLRLATDKQNVFEVERVIRKAKPGKLSRAWKNLERVTKGQLVARYSDGSELLAPYDGYVFLPNPASDFGTEWLYFARLKFGQSRRVKRLRSTYFHISDQKADLALPTEFEL